MSTFDDFYLACAAVVDARRTRALEQRVPLTWSVNDACTILFEFAGPEFTKAAHAAANGIGVGLPDSSYSDGTQQRPVSRLARLFGFCAEHWPEQSAA